MAPKEPTTWDEYDRGASPGRSGSTTSLGQNSVRFEEEGLLGDRESRGQDGEWPMSLRRRSSVTNRLAAITDIGGVNSIRSFTRSWQRAAAFPEILPQRPAFVFAPDQEPVHAVENISYGRSHVPAGPSTSLLRRGLEGEPADNDAIIDDESGTPGTPPTRSRHNERKYFDNELSRIISPSGSARSNSIFDVPPHLAVPAIVGSFGSYRSYGTTGSDADLPSMANAAEIWPQQQEYRSEVPEGGRPAVLVKEVEQEDGNFALEVCGRSTLPQTVVNSTNVLIGVGLLSLPIGLKYAGWLCGMISLFLCAAVTSWTARLLSKCMDRDRTALTFSDIAYTLYGKKARLMTSILFMLELLAACVALIVLFADSLKLLFPGTLSVNQWKILCILILIPLQFAPLSILSYTSAAGIFSVLSIAIIVILDGLLKPHTPGSLIEPAKTYLFPSNWLTLPLSFGLLMSPWGGHSVFPNIYRDMRHRHRYNEAVTITFTFTYILDTLVAVVGLVMFGDGVRDEITSNILKTTGYPHALNVLLVIFIAIIPLTKIPLNAQPIITTFEILLGLRQQVMADSSTLIGRSSTFRGFLKIAIRILTLVVFLVIAILFPAFDSIMAFMGSALCFTICVTLPLVFYLNMFWDDITRRERVFAQFVMVLSSIISIFGTVWAFLPKSLIGA